MLGEFTLVLLVPLVVAFAVYRARRGVPRRRVELETAFGLYLLLLTAVVLFPLRVDAGLRADDAVWDYATFLRDWVNLTPGRTFAQLLARSSPTQALRQLGGNLLLLAPLGALVPALAPRMRRFVAMLALAVGSGLGIELVQYLARVARLSLRSVDVDDAILNVVGAMLGFALWWAWRRVRAGRAQVAAER